MPKTTSFRHMKLHVKSQIVMYVNSRPSTHIHLRNLFISLHNLIITYIPFIAMYKQFNLPPILYLCLVLMGLRSGCGVGAAGCLWIGSCFRRLWCLGGFGAVVFGTLLRLELEGSREGILYDEIYITILNWIIIVYFIMPKYFDRRYYRHGLWTLLMRARILLYVYIFCFK